MENEIEVSRREFLGASVGAAAGLIVGYYVPGSAREAMAAESAAPKAAAPAAKVYPPNAFVQIAPDNSITIVINKLEMGQGVNTSMAQLIAEELECDWKSIHAVSAPVNPVYNHTAMPTQMTGGSSALISSWDQHRKIGACLREMLRTAAAQKWSVPVGEVHAQSGFIVHPKKGKLSYGELATAANQLPIPDNPPLKSAKDFKIIGKPMPRVDALAKSNGKAVYGMDVRVSGMLYAMVARPSILDAKLISANESAARKVHGVVDVVKFSNRVAVLAKNTYAAKQGQAALAAKWESSNASTEDLMTSFKAQSHNRGLIADERGTVESAMNEAGKRLTAEYEFPFLAHATMEPMNCTINYNGKFAEIWSGHQMPAVDAGVAAKVLDLKPEQVKVNTVYAGGSFGRRASKTSDYVLEACQLAKIVKKPLKVVWSREDDMRGGSYRPMNFHRVMVGLDPKSKNIAAWDHHIVGQTVVGGSVFEGMIVKNGLEATVTEGVSETPYALENFRCEQTRASSPLTTLWWRSVGHTHTAYVMETMMDEVAEATGRDPFELRHQLLAKKPRQVAVLELLKKKSGWGNVKPPKGRAWGMAIHESFNSVVGHVAEVSLEKGQPRVHRVWSAVHCGQVVNPEGARTQVESAIVFGLSAALGQQIELKNGEIQQNNFDTYPVMRLPEMPVVTVDFVPSTDHPTGLGEPGLPAIAPAVANAIYKLNKKRLRRLPFSRELQA